MEQNEKQNVRKDEFKKGIRSEEKTRQREEELISIRKAKREEKLDIKRRQIENAPIITNDAPIIPPASLVSLEDERKARQSERTGEFKKGITRDEAFAKRSNQEIARIKMKRKELLDKHRAIQKKLQSSQPRILGMQEWKNMIFLSSDSEDNVKKVHRAIHHFRSLTSSGKDVSKEIQEIIDLGLVPRIIELANASKFPKIQYEATWLLTNITSGNSEHTSYVAFLPNVIDVLVRILSSSSDEKVRENAVWTLANIAGDNLVFRNNVLTIPHVIELLLNNLTSSKEMSNTKTTVWCISNLFRGKPFPNVDESNVVAVIQTFAKMLNGIDSRSSQNDEILSDICLTFSYISDQTENMVVPKYGDLLIRSHVIDKMIELLYSKAVNIKQPSLRTIGNLVAGTAEQTSYVLEHNFLIKAVSLLNLRSESIRRETVWILSNIAAGTAQQKNVLMRSGLVEKVIRLFESDTHNVKKECLWVISNLCDSSDYIAHVVKYGILPALCDALGSSDPKFLLKALLLLEKILKFSSDYGKDYNDMAEDADCIDKLEALQEHANIDIYEMAVHLIEKYFPQEEPQIYSPTMPRWDREYSPTMPKWNEMSTDDESSKPKTFNF
jgi:importin subunit alpha-6/7